MTLEEERLVWKHDAQHLDKYVTSMVEVLRDDANAVPVSYMAVDMIYRPYIQWLHSAQLQKLDASQTRNSAVHLVNMMILEMLVRMTIREDVQAAMDWVDDFVEILQQELDEDLRLLVRRMNATNDNKTT